VLASIERADEKRRALVEQRDGLLMEIHDGVSGSLARAAMLLVEGERGACAIVGARDAISDGLEEVRAMARLLAPRASSFDVLAAEIRRATADACDASSIRLAFDVAGPTEPLPLSPAAAHALRRAAREATTNVLKYAGACTVRRRLEASAAAVVLSIEDDGRGFSGERSGGRGLGIMARRASRIGGRVDWGDRPEGGAFVRMTLPRDG
jgi:signal transduction histidine kinase